MINIEGETIPNSQDTLAKQAPLLQLSSNDLWRRMSPVVLGVPHNVNMLTRQPCSHGRRKTYKQQTTRTTLSKKMNQQWSCRNLFMVARFIAETEKMHKHAPLFWSLLLI